MIPGHEGKQKNVRAVMVVIDLFSRFTETEILSSRDTRTVLLAFNKILQRLGQNPHTLITDREGAIMSKDFRASLIPKGIQLKLVPRDRHHIFNSFAERIIQKFL